MCTAVSFTNGSFYFGRNFDYPVSYEEEVIITPREYNFKYKFMSSRDTHPAIIGIGILKDDYPLYYDAVNEYGLSVAGLAFPKSAVYLKEDPSKTNLAPFEVIPYILSSCKDLSSARKLLEITNIVDINFSDNLKNTPLHWIIASKEGSFVVEPRGHGLEIYDNPTGVLTNEPPFDFHLENLKNYMHLSPAHPYNNFSSTLSLAPCSHGMGATGLPGDFSSASRFIKGAFTLLNSTSDDTENSNVTRLFHVLNSVSQIKGCTITDNGTAEYTVYSSCCNADSGVYYYTSYENLSINSVDLSSHNLSSRGIIHYPLRFTPKM